MKTKSNIIRLVAAAAVLSPFALAAETLTYTNVPNGSFYDSQYWTNAAGENVLPDASSDIVFAGLQSNGGWTISAKTTDVTVNSITDTVTVDPDNPQWGQSLSIDLGEKTFTVVGDVNVNSNHRNTQFAFVGTGSLVIGGNLNIAPKKLSGESQSMFGSGSMLKSMSVGGNFNIGGDDGSLDVRLFAENVSVKGKLNYMSNQETKLYLSGSDSAGVAGGNIKITLGGLNDSFLRDRNLLVARNYKKFSDSSITLTFTNSDTSKFKGKIAAGGNGTIENSTFNIVMDKSATGTQYFEDTGVDYAIKNVTVNGGTLKFFSTGGNSAFALNGGTLSAATTASEVAALKGESLAWSGGTLAFDVAQDGEALVSDTINLSGVLSKAATEGAEASRTITIAVSDSSDIAGWLGSQTGQETTLTLANYGSTDLTASDITVKSLIDGVKIKSFEVGAGSITVTLAAVPEPATIAALLGLAALGLAIARRRR